jgi:nitroreductase
VRLALHQAPRRVSSLLLDNREQLPRCSFVSANGPSATSVSMSRTRTVVAVEVGCTGHTAYDAAMDTFLAIASKRDTRRYADRPISDEITERILDGGRLAGSARNRQSWRFLLIESPEVKGRLAETVYAPDNVHGAQLVVAIQSSASVDVGRSIQNMMLAAWNEGVVSCPNGIADATRAREVLGLGEDEPVAIVLTFGYPARERDPLRHTPEEWSKRADRKPLDQLIERL